MKFLAMPLVYSYTHLIHIGRLGPCITSVGSAVKSLYVLRSTGIVDYLILGQKKQIWRTGTALYSICIRY